MKRIWLLIMLALMLVPLTVAATPIKQASEFIGFWVREPLDSAYGIPRKPDSAHVETRLDNGSSTAFTTRSTTYPFSGIGIDTTKNYSDTTYWFSDQIQDIDGAGCNCVLDVVVSLFYDDIGTETHYSVQVVADSLNQALNDATLTRVYIGEHGLGIFVDSTAGNTNTVIGVDGTEKNPVSTLAAARTLALALGAHRFYIHGGSTFNGATTDLGADYSTWEFYGEGHGIELAFGGQLTTNSYFHNITLSGAMHASGANALFQDCDLGFVSSNFSGTAYNCLIKDTLVLKTGRDIRLIGCFSGVPGNDVPTINFSAGSSVAEIRGYSGGMRFMNGASNDTISIEANGQLIISANNTSLVAVVRGFCTITDSGTTTALTKDAVFSRQEAGLWIWSNIDTTIVDSSELGAWLSTGYNAILAYMDTLIYRGGVWVDAGANTNTVVGVDGTPKNPVGTIAAAKTIADALGISTIFFLDGANETIGATMEDYKFVGVTRSATVNLGGQDVDNSFFENITITGTQGGTGLIVVINSGLVNLDSLQIHARNCAVMGTLSLRGGIKTNYFDKCYSSVAGNNTPSLDFNDASDSIYVNWRAYSGGLELLNMTTNHVMSYESDGQIIVNANSDNGNLTLRGMMTITDNGTSMSITKDAVFSREDADLWVRVWGRLADSAYAAGTFGDSAKGWGATAASSLDSQVVSNIVWRVVYGLPKGSGDDSTTLAQRKIHVESMLADVITAAIIAQDAIGNSEIAVNAIGQSEIAADAIGASEITFGAIGADELATSAAQEIARETFSIAGPDDSSYAAGTMGKDAEDWDATGASSLDSGIVSRIVHRVSWGTPKGSGDDSSTSAQRDVGTVGDGAKSAALVITQDTLNNLSTTLTSRYSSLLQFLGWGEIAGDAVWSQDRPNADADTLWVGTSDGAGVVDTAAYQVIFHVGGTASDAPDSTKSYLWP